MQLGLRVRTAILFLLAGTASSWAQACPGEFQADTGYLGAMEVPPIVSLAPRVLCGVMWDPDGPGPLAPRLVVGGYLGGIDGVTSKCVAAWDGSHWQALPGLGVTNSSDGVTALAVHNGSLYAAGRVSLNNDIVSYRVLRWDGSAWTSLPGVINGPINTMASFAGELWIGGSFAAVGGRDFAHLVGDSWTGFALGSGNPGASSSAVMSMVVHQGELVVGGSFPNRIMRWTGTAPNGSFGATLSCPISCSGGVQQMLSDGTTLYAGGSYALWPNSSRPGVMRWDGSTWTAMPLSGNGSPTVTSLAIDSTGLIATDGDFTSLTPSRLLRWNGAQWIEFGPVDWRSASSAAFLIVGVQGQNVFLGGTFTEVVDNSIDVPLRPVRMIAQWDGVRAKALTRGVDARVTSMVPWSGGQTLAVGRFRAAGTTPADRIALYDAQGEWHPFEGNQGFDGDAWCAAVHQGQLIVGGAFAAAGSVPVSRVARWTGSAWEAFGAATDYPSTFALGTDDLFMATTLSSGSAAPYTGVWRWDGSAWSLVPGTSGTSGLRAVGGTVYLNSASAAFPRPILRWTGAAFEGLPLPPAETSLGLMGTRAGVLYATGLEGIYRWTGSAFELAAERLNIGGAVAGPQTADDGVLLHLPVNASSFEQVYSWDGASWSTAGQFPLTPQYGTALQVTSLRPPALYWRGPDLLVGGAFQYLGQNRATAASYFARSLTTARPITTSAPPLLVQRDAGDNVMLTWTLAGDVTSYRWLRNSTTTLADGVVDGLGTVSGSTTASLTISGLDTRAGGTYHCIARYACGQVTLQHTTLVVSCNADFNADGNVDQDDVAYLVNLAAGGDNPSGHAGDFNHDGNVDQDDVRALVDVVAGGECP